MAFLCIQDAERLCKTSRTLFEDHFGALVVKRRFAAHKIARCMRLRMPVNGFVDMDAMGWLTRRGHAMFAAYWFPEDMRGSLIQLTSTKSYEPEHRRVALEKLARGGPYTQQDIIDLMMSAQSVDAIAYVGW